MGAASIRAVWGKKKSRGGWNQFPQGLNRLVKKSNSNARPLKGHLTSNDLRYR